MFKALSDNISSLIGGGQNPQTGSESSDKGSVANPTQSESQIETSSKEGVLSQENTTEGQEENGTQKGKLPPPRPNPPLTTAGSLSRQDTLPESQGQGEPHAETSATSHSVSSADGSMSTGGDEASEDANGNSDKKDKLDEVAGKAREWGSYLFSMTKNAGASVSAKAKELKKVVAENTIIGDFVKEQDKFVSEKKEKARASEAAVPPWVGYNEEEQMKTQMLALSNDKRNFLRNPPTGVQFHFDYDTCYPVAMATLADDDRLQEMRFELVPKRVTEHDFWRNYFYRVSLIKQSTQLTSLAKQSSGGSTSTDSNVQVDKSSSDPAAKSVEKVNRPLTSEAASADIGDAGNDETELAGGNDEFISDAYNLEISDEDLMREMEALRASPGVEDQEWEQELQKELNDYEVVTGSNELDDAALEKEIMQEIKQSSTD